METLGTSERICLEWPGISTPDKFSLILSSKGEVTWFINGECYGENRRPGDAVGHLGCLLGWEHEAPQTLKDFFRVRGYNRNDTIKRAK